jgi:site-specific DNA-methyltransferase (adenine-specific)
MTVADVIAGQADWAVECGDALAVLPRIPAGSVAAVITDPPYGLRRTARYNLSQQGSRRKWGREWADGREVIAGDEAGFDPAPWLAFPRVALFGANHFASRLPDSPAWVVWDKKDGLPPSQTSDCELIWTNAPRAVRAYRQMWCGITRAGEENVARQPKFHPYQKPVALLRWLLDYLAVPEGGLVLDPYCGSGSTGLACLRTGRRFIGVEIDPGYATVARRRIFEDAPLFNGTPPAEDGP